MRSRWPRRVGIAVLAVVTLLVLGWSGLWLALHHPLSDAVPGPQAEALAHQVEQAVNLPAWQRTGAVRWTFGGRNHHLWDRQRGLDRVRFGDHEVLVDLGKVQGRAYQGGAELHGAAAERLVKKAYAAWINDSFWLNPLAKFYDPGVERLLAQVPGEAGPALLIQYRSGGLTPGDRYLWLLGPDHVPRAWRMYVSILPIAGLEASWEGWTRLSTGALVATRHRLGPAHVDLSDVAGAATLAELEPGPDPFARMMSP